MNIIVIDDERTFKTDREVEYFRTAQDGLVRLVEIWMDSYAPFSQTRIDELWLDHDLGPFSKSIRLVVNFLTLVAELEAPFVVGTIYVHSMNPVGGAFMVSDLSKNYNVKRVPLPELMS